MTSPAATSRARHPGHGREAGDFRSGSIGHLPLHWRVFAGNATVLGLAVLVLAVTPARVTVPTRLDEAVVLVGGVTALLLTNLVLLTHAFAPLARLTELMRRVEPLEPGRRIPVYGDDAEVVELTRAFNEMLDRLEEERRESVRRSLQAQEGERRRVAQELHDEVGQMLTAIVLRLNRMEREAPATLRSELAETREDARASLEDVRRIAQRLRPEALEDLGLASALEVLCVQVAERGGLRIRTQLDGHLSHVTPEMELVVYRVTQEALTNALRHAEASEVLVELRCEDDALTLRVADDGRGVDGASPGSGIQGMRERALLVDGRLAVRALDRGTEVRLRLPRDP
jgi:two-component system, NarL family, sensor histidine kinase UhpB